MRFVTFGCTLALFAGLSSAAPILNHRSLSDRLVDNFDSRGDSRFQAGPHWAFDEFKLSDHKTSFREALDQEMSKHHWFTKDHNWKDCDGSGNDEWKHGKDWPGNGDGGGGDPSSVPEPATMGLLGTALLGLGWLRSRQAGIR